MKRRNLSAICSASILFGYISFITGCGENKTGSQKMVGSWVEEGFSESVKAEDYNGYSFYILVQEDETNLGSHNTICAEDLAGCVYQDAVTERNKQTENLLNISIVQNTGNVSSSINSDIQAGISKYDIAYPDFEAAARLSVKMVLQDLNQLEDLGLKQPWWDEASVRDLTIAGSLWFAENSINLQYVDSTYLLFFNKDLLTDLAFENPCQLVREGRWTFDAFYNMICAAAEDTNNNGTADAPGDYFGLKTSGYLKAALLSGAREYLVLPNSDGICKPNIFSEKVLNVAEFADKILGNTKATAAAWNGEGMEAFNLYANTVYNGHTLFCEERLCRYEQLTEASEDDFGFLPFPKASEEQDFYGSGVYWFRHTTLCYVIPVNATDLHRTCQISETLAVYSYKKLYNAYYASIHKNDPESYDMLKIIDSSRIYDLGFIFNWGDIAGLFSVMTHNTYREGAKEYDSVLSKFDKQMRHAINVYNNGRE